MDQKCRRKFLELSIFKENIFEELKIKFEIF